MSLFKISLLVWAYVKECQKTMLKTMLNRKKISKPKILKIYRHVDLTLAY